MERKKNKTFKVRGVQFEMVAVPGGTLTLGATEEQHQLGYEPEDETPHKVTLDDYYIGQTVVTQELWETVMGYHRCDPHIADAPIDLVSWYECQKFIEKLNYLTGYKFRLPTEAEWEYAARGSEMYEDWWIYAGSDYIENVAPVSKETPIRVMQYRPNDLGIYDMTGFVFQWCADWYGEYPTEPQLNPQGPENGKQRVARGGSWNNNSDIYRSIIFCRTASRHCEYPEEGHGTLGFRLAMSAAEAEKDYKKRPNIAAYGESLYDHIDTEFIPGGAPLNFALACKQLVDGEVTMISAVGNDDLGDNIVKLVENRGVHGLIARVNAPTGTVDANVDTNGIPTYTIYENVAYDMIPVTPEIENVVKNADCFCYGTLASRSRSESACSRSTLQHLLSLLPNGATRVLDINLRPTFDDDDFLMWCMKHCDILKLNEDEMMILANKLSLTGRNNEERCHQIMEHFPITMIVLTMGTNGSYIFTPFRSSFKQTPQVDTKDSVGCGDSMTAAFVASLCANLELEKCHSLAVDVSAYTATQIGGQPMFPENIKAMFR